MTPESVEYLLLTLTSHAGALSIDLDARWVLHEPPTIQDRQRIRLIESGLRDMLTYLQECKLAEDSSVVKELPKPSNTG